MLVRIFAEYTEPAQYGNFAPAARCDFPVLIGGCMFHSLRQFLYYNMFIDHDKAYAELFASDNEARLRTEYTRLYSREFGAPVSPSLEDMLDFMKRPDTFLAYQKLVSSPSSSAFFKELEAAFRTKADEIVLTWVSHRFAETLLDRPDITFVSDTYVQYVAALNEFFGRRKYRRKRIEVSTLSRLLRPEVCLLDLVFKGKGSAQRTEAKSRLLMSPADPENLAQGPLRKLIGLLRVG